MTVFRAFSARALTLHAQCSPHPLPCSCILPYTAHTTPYTVLLCSYITSVILIVYNAINRLNDSHSSISALALTAAQHSIGPYRSLPLPRHSLRLPHTFHPLPTAPTLLSAQHVSIRRCSRTVRHWYEQHETTAMHLDHAMPRTA